MAIDRALDLFWERGYRSTTTRDLEVALDMRAPSIYNAFGSKQALLVRAIDRYQERVDRELVAVLDIGPDGHAAVIAFFQELCAWLIDNRHRGCLVVNLMAGEVADEDVARRARDYRHRIRTGLSSALARTGCEPATAAARADLLTATVLGLHITARAVDGDEITALVEATCREVASWRSRQPG